ncbi:phosphoenolpyruvate mutase [Terribacillus saccharophilus]|uniref:phosphoenolpyruvate mutase n=1 Tax=Terribacillus saccharophilus TaxID=361277 RepID=UPI00382D5F6A
MHKTKTLRNLLASNSLTKVIGAHDGISSIIAEKNGFDAIWASGLEISAAHGYPDASILTMTEFLNAAQVINRSTSLPVIADCDSGFGDVNNVRRMVEEYERAGIAGICIEDKVFPKRNSFLETKQELADIDEFALKIKVAKMTQQNEDFVVIARLESLIAKQGIDDAYNRAEQYAKAGADAILVHSKSKDSSEVLEFAALWSKSEFNSIPLVIVPTTYFTIDLDQLNDTPIQMVIYANQGLRAAIQGIQNSTKLILENKGTSIIENQIASVKTVFELIGTNKISETETWYKSELEKLKEQSVF